MLIKENEVNLIKQNKVVLIKNFTNLNKTYDFNFISKILEENNLCVVNKTSLENLKGVFQVKEVTNVTKEFEIFFDFLSKLFKYERHAKDGVDLFFSFVSQVGNSHTDMEDVFILGLEGEVVYRVFGVENKNYYVKKGDMIFIPKGLKHKVIGMNPRIIASIGFYGERKN